MKKLLLIMILLFVAELTAQGSGSYYNPKDDQFRILGLKRAKEAYESVKTEYERNKQLLSKGLISQKDFERVKNTFADTEVNYHQALLAVLFEKQYISVVEAIKYQAADGKKHVKLKIANTSQGGAEFQKLINIDDELFRSLQPETANNIYISLLNDNNAIISQPYEIKIDQLKYGKPVTVDFILLQDLDAVTVNLIYGSGSQRAPKIYLQKDASVNKVVFQSEQFSQEVELGKEATYDLTLELFSGNENTFKLETVNLPKVINSYFSNPATGARLSQYKFTQDSQTKKAALKIYLPDRPDETLKLDKGIEFYAIAIPYDRIGEVKIQKDKIYTLKEIEEMNLGYLKLELVTKGKGELVVKAAQLFYSIYSGEDIKFPLQIYNEGSRNLSNIEFTVELPFNWQRKIQPEVMKSLNIREEKNVEFEIYPPDDIAPGKYEVRIKTTSLSDNQVIRTDDKIITIEIKEETSLVGTLILIMIIASIIVGIVVFGIKLTRK